MTNEIAKQTNQEVEIINEVNPVFNDKAGDKIIRISIKCRKMKTLDGKNEFNSIKGLKHLRVYDDEGVDIGKHNRWLDVHFTQDAFSVDKQPTRNFDNLMDLTTGFLYVKAKFIDSPRTYRITEDKDTGELKYPEIWIKGGIAFFEPLVAEQDEFDYVEPESKNAINAPSDTYADNYEPVEMNVKAE